MLKELFARKPLSLFKEEMEGEHRLRRALGPWSLTALGIGCVIGAGIFVVTGRTAHNITGPAVIISYVVAGLACIFAALCYAEFAAMVPVAGSAYTYAYATLGELFAWIIGWDLILEYTVASAAVASGWSEYLQSFLKNALGVELPKYLQTAPFSDTTVHTSLFGVQMDRPGLTFNNSLLDLPAMLIIVVLTVLLVIGIRESSRFNIAMVGVKLAAVVFVILVGIQFINPANWHPFAPHGWTGVSFFGHTVLGQSAPDGKPLGMLAGAAAIFFAYIGFDTVSTHAEEAKNPQRDLPFGIITSLIVCTLLYVAVSAVLTGMVPYGQIDIHAAVANAFVQHHMIWAADLISIGAVAGLTSVLLVLLLGQPRIYLAMARDGLLPRSFFAAVHPKFRTPWKSTLLTGVVVALLSALVPLNTLFELVNIGTLLAFVIVCVGILIMRATDPHAERPFRCPWVPGIPIVGILLCLLLMFSLPPQNWLRLIIWLIIGLVIYLSYGRRHSVMARLRAGEPVEAEEVPDPDACKLIE